MCYLKVGHHQPGCQGFTGQSQVASRKGLEHRRIAATPPPLHKSKSQGDDAAPVAPLNHVQLEVNNLLVPRFILSQRCLRTYIPYLAKSFLPAKTVWDRF